MLLPHSSIVLFDGFGSAVGAELFIEMVGYSLVVNLDRTSGDDVKEHLLVDGV